MTPTRTSAPTAAFSSADLETLRSRLRGPLVAPGEPDYEGCRTVWNAMIDRRPALIARCLGTSDVITALAIARERDLPISIKGGGHNISGLAVADGALMLDLSLMRGAWVDRERKIVRAQAGCLLGDVDRETQVHGLATTLGFVSNTGVAGLTLGGGFGYLSRRFGWTSDGVLGMDLVTAEGRVIRASEQENADLFWGLRGGGGNFGVVTGIDYRLHAIGPEIVAGAIAWKADRARELFALYRTLIAEAPPTLTCAALIRLAPPAPWIAPEVHGKPIVVFAFCHTGSIEEGERAAAPLKAFGMPVGDLIQRRSYVSQQCLLDATQPKGRRYYWKSEYLSGADPELVASILDHADRLPSPHSGIVLFPIDGPLNRLPNDHSAVGNRDARLVINVTASWERPEDDVANVEWARAAWRDARRFSTGGTYVNFLTEEETGDRVRDAYGANYDRLAEIKSRWDPENRFRANKNIAPRGATV